MLDSLLNQTYDNFEICLADGSTSQEPGEFVKKQYGRKKESITGKLKENKGISGNTNAALSMARGDLHHAGGS